MDQPRLGWMDSLLRNALTSVGEELRQAAWRTLTALASAIALAVILTFVAAATVVIGVWHVAAGIHALVSTLIGGSAWLPDLLTGALLLAVPVTGAVILACRQPGKRSPP